MPAPAVAAAATNPPAYYRLSQLDDVLARAKKEDRPIAWIASFPGSMTPHKNPLARSSQAATYYAYLILCGDAIIVWVTPTPRTTPNQRSWTANSIAQTRTTPHPASSC